MEKDLPTTIRASLSLAAVILGAGSSRRMGTPKLLLPWAGTSILGHLIQQWQALTVAQLAVVVSNEGADVCRELDRLAFPPENRISNFVPERGMFGSIQCAARWPGWSDPITHWVILLGDQPHLKALTLRQLLDFAAQNRGRVCQPKHQSQWRHPVVLPKTIFTQLSSSKATTLREFLSGCDRAGFEAQDPGLDYDIDTPHDYQKALARLSSRIDLSL